MSTRTSRKIGTTVLISAAMVGAAVVATTAKAPVAQANGHDRDGDNWGPQRYSIALWGDMPYDALGKQQYPNLLADINATRRRVLGLRRRPEGRRRRPLHRRASTRPRSRTSTRCSGR